MYFSKLKNRKDSTKAQFNVALYTNSCLEKGKGYTMRVGF